MRHVMPVVCWLLVPADPCRCCGWWVPGHGRQMCTSLRGRPIPANGCSGMARRTAGSQLKRRAGPSLTVIFTFTRARSCRPAGCAGDWWCSLLKRIRAAAASRAVMSGVVERIETLASAPTVLKNYPAVVNHEIHLRRNVLGLRRYRHHFRWSDHNQGQIALAKPGTGGEIAERVRGRHEDRRSAGAGEARSRGAAPAQDRKPVRLHKR